VPTKQVCYCEEQSDEAIFSCLPPLEKGDLKGDLYFCRVGRALQRVCLTTLLYRPRHIREFCKTKYWPALAGVDPSYQAVSAFAESAAHSAL
jgi:hypothetical protein